VTIEECGRGKEEAMKYSISNWIYGEEPLRTTFERLRRYGYDGIELRGEPQKYDPEEVNQLCREFDLQVFSVLGWSIWPLERDLANPDPQRRGKALDYATQCVDLASAVGAPLVVVIPAPAGRTTPLGDVREEEEWVAEVGREWNYALESVRGAAGYAEGKGILLAVEPINRYESFLVNNVEQGARFVLEVGSRVVRLHLDTFHMNIEEREPAEAIRKAGELLVNLHISDSNRMPPGYGHTDFGAIMKALNEIGYGGPLTLEPVPPEPNALLAVEMRKHLALRDRYAEESIAYLRRLEGR
jgi:sugar phosphate isomerase/epimerase